jgi:ferredoxin
MGWPVAPHDDIRKYVETCEGPFAAIHCICRQGKDLAGEPCRQTKERKNCLLIGPPARTTTDAGIARELSREEMLAMLDQADRDGLVLQPQNTQAPMFVCCCCGCCCGLLTSAQKFEQPADAFQAGYVAEIDRARCGHCGACETRCQMDAISHFEGTPRVDEARCIGCGLCVTTCPPETIRLRRLEGARTPPKGVRELYTRMYRERFGRAGLAVALARHVLGGRV